MTNVKGNAKGEITAMTTDKDFPGFIAQEKFYSLASGFMYSGWMPLSLDPNERRHLRINVSDSAAAPGKTFILSPENKDASVVWFKSLLGTTYPPFETTGGELTLDQLDKHTGAVSGTFRLTARSSQGESVTITGGTFDLQPNDQAD
ncbi:hypothetical protein M5G22_17100 [Pseudomonas sp. TNT2022 ID233]|uniref:hypothetical protein n=1 Tax=Pseudomonas aphyarum TaxID=2942629 RepID=UPI0023628111|nr:hypothetical protein [Pseudomonas aphyarum]MDD1139275.1 hypothetical protein [Pseudomonas aphyarum]